MSIHRLPPRFINDDDLPPEYVVIAPDPIDRAFLIAWAVGRRGPVALERATDHDHVRRDAMQFAGRCGVPLHWQPTPFTTDTVNGGAP